LLCRDVIADVAKLLLHHPVTILHNFFE
jgi:hypothetical protein